MKFPRMAGAMAAKTIGAGVGGMGETIFAMDQEKKKREMLAHQQQVEADRFNKSYAQDERRLDLSEQDNRRQQEMFDYNRGPGQQVELAKSGFRPYDPSSAPKGATPVTIGSAQYYDSEPVVREQAATAEHQRRLTEIGASNAQRLAEFNDEKTQREIEETKDAIRSMAERSSREMKAGQTYDDVERAILKRFRGGKLPQSVIQAEIAAGRSRHLADVQGFSNRAPASGEQGGGLPQQREITQDQYSKIISDYEKSGISRQEATQRAAKLYIVR